MSTVLKQDLPLFEKPAKTKRRHYSAQSIVVLLEQRHSKDVFIPECKDGPTQFGHHVRLDGWAMNKSWAHPCVTGYEVKVSRSDFINDNKWPSYLPLCNQFYFVAPKGIIDPSELSADVGLLVVAGEGTGTRLLTKKKAAYRDVVIPEEVWRYILMCRVEIIKEVRAISTPQEVWRAWLERKSEDRTLGYEVSKAIRERAREFEHENKKLRGEYAKYDGLLALLDSLGVNPAIWGMEEKLQAKIEARSKVFEPELVGTLRSLQKLLDSALTKIEQVDQCNSVTTN